MVEAYPDEGTEIPTEGEIPYDEIASISLVHFKKSGFSTAFKTCSFMQEICDSATINRDDYRSGVRNVQDTLT
jgi:hypothetical protein